MENTEPLVWYGALVLTVTGALILVPYMRRKADLLTGWNLLLISAAIFIGLGCFEAVSTGPRQENLQDFHPTKSDIRWYLSTTTVFLSVLIVSYYYNPIARSLAGRSLAKWPPLTPALFLMVIGICFVVQVLSMATMGQVFFGPLLFKLSHKALAFMTVFAFMLWYRNRLNLFWLGLFCAVFLFACLTSIRFGTGRRLLLSMFVGPLLCFYWMQARHWRPTRSLVLIGIAAFAVFIIGLMYSSIRHFSQIAGQLRQERTTSAIIEQIRSVRSRPWLERYTNDKLFYFSQQCVHYSLLVKRHVDNGRLEPKPLNTLYFAVVYPIPRRIWPDKPVLLGAVAPRVIAQTPTTNWGVGIPGHAAYEGGILVAALYAFILAFAIRFFDDPLYKQPANPFLISMLAAASPHIVGWTRGDLGNMTLEAGECVLFAFILSVVCRMLFGTERPNVRGRVNPAAADHAYPYVAQPIGPRPTRP